MAAMIQRQKLQQRQQQWQSSLTAIAVTSAATDTKHGEKENIARKAR